MAGPSDNSSFSPESEDGLTVNGNYYSMREKTMKNYEVDQALLEKPGSTPSLKS